MKSNGLELYAKIEDMLDFSEAIEKLYTAFYVELAKLDVKTVLDIGCGSGAFGKGIERSGFEFFGVDLSQKMVEATKELGLKAENIDICELKEEFDAATAVFDVLNYMDESLLERFFGCVRQRVKKGGYFLADINTLHGFSEVAPGTICLEDESRVAVIDADFDGGSLLTNIKLFSLRGDGAFEREDGEILQYYHSRQKIEKLSKMKVVSSKEIALYGKKADKYLFVFQNS